MKVKFNRSALQESLALVTSIVPNKTPKPILKCVKVSADESSVSICSTDLEAGISIKMAQVEVESPGEFVAPASEFNSIIRESLDDVLDIEAGESTIQIRGADAHFTIYGHEASQYPVVPDFDGESDMETSLEQLQEGIELALFSAARESNRYAINGILWEPAGKKLRLVSTDGRRLARSVVNLSKGAPEGTAEKGIIVPTKTMALLDRVVGGEEQIVAVRFVDNKIILNCGDVVISSNLVEGNFPKYEDIIPKDHDKRITLPTETSLSAVRRAALLSNEDSKGIKLAISEGSIIFTCRAPETGDSQIDMKIDYSGPDIQIGFNPQFLIDALRVIKAPDFVLELGTSDRPGVIKSGNNFIYVVMPVNLD